MLTLSATLLPLSAMMLVQAMAAMALVAVPVLAPEIAAALDVDTATVGLYQSIAFVGTALGPSTFGAIVAMTGSYAAAFIAIDVLLLATLATLVIRPRRAAGQCRVSRPLSLPGHPPSPPAG